MKILATAVAFAALGAFLGLICGVLYSFGGFVIDLFTTGLNFGTLLAFGALVGMPAVFGAFGFFFGAVLGGVLQIVSALIDRDRTFGT